MQPTKQQVRDWLKKEVEARRPPPAPDQIRRELGWDWLKPKRDDRSKT